ncbi:hypothetical protein EJB05_13184, partial [Eragrostis curvula]
MVRGLDVADNDGLASTHRARRRARICSLRRRTSQMLKSHAGSSYPQLESKPARRLVLHQEIHLSERRGGGQGMHGGLRPHLASLRLGGLFDGRWHSIAAPVVAALAATIQDAAALAATAATTQDAAALAETAAAGVGSASAAWASARLRPCCLITLFFLGLGNGKASTYHRGQQLRFHDTGLRLQERAHRPEPHLLHRRHLLVLQRRRQPRVRPVRRAEHDQLRRQRVGIVLPDRKRRAAELGRDHQLADEGAQRVENLVGGGGSGSGSQEVAPESRQPHAHPLVRLADGAAQNAPERHGAEVRLVVARHLLVPQHGLVEAAVASGEQREEEADVGVPLGFPHAVLQDTHEAALGGAEALAGERGLAEQHGGLQRPRRVQEGAPHGRGERRAVDRAVAPGLVPRQGADGGVDRGHAEEHEGAAAEETQRHGKMVPWRSRVAAASAPSALLCFAFLPGCRGKPGRLIPFDHISSLRLKMDGSQ